MTVSQWDYIRVKLGLHEITCFPARIMILRSSFTCHSARITILASSWRAVTPHLTLLRTMTLKLATLYIIVGSISFFACILTFILLIKKFLDRPFLHCFFSYSDTIASSLFSLALLLNGIIGLVPSIVQQSCYHFKLLNGLFVVAIVTGFFSVLGISIERFHMFAVVRDYTTIRRKFSIFWFLSSWTLSIVFVIILLPQIQDEEPVSHRNQ